MGAAFFAGGGDALRVRGSEWLLLIACFGLLVVGPAMAFQEFAQMEDARREAEEEAAAARLTESPVRPHEPDLSFREAWRWPLFALVAVVGILGSVVAVRVAKRRRWRAVSGRLLGLLLLGMTLVEANYLVDVGWAFGLPYLARGWTTVWVYPLGAVLVGGALYRLSELEPHFGSDRAPPPVLSPAVTGEWLDHRDVAGHVQGRDEATGPTRRG